MKVKELIAVLQRLDQEAKVFIYDKEDAAYVEKEIELYCETDGGYILLEDFE